MCEIHTNSNICLSYLYFPSVSFTIYPKVQKKKKPATMWHSYITWWQNGIDLSCVQRCSYIVGHSRYHGNQLTTIRLRFSSFSLFLKNIIGYNIWRLLWNLLETRATNVFHLIEFFHQIRNVRSKRHTETLALTFCPDIKAPKRHTKLVQHGVSTNSRHLSRRIRHAEQQWTFNISHDEDGTYERE